MNTAPSATDELELSDGSSVDLSQPVVAYKLARIVGGGDGELNFAGAGRNVSYEAEGTATCQARLHRAPNQKCGCGFWGIYHLTDLYEAARHATGLHRYDTFVRLTVELTGPAELHELGLRARTQRVLSAALPTTCARCKNPSVKAVLTKGPVSEVLTVCDKHVRENERVYSAVDLSNALGTEVSFSRSLADESNTARYTNKPHGPLYNTFATPFSAMIGVVMFMAATMSILLAVMVLLAFNGTFYEDLAPMLAQAASHPGQIVSYDGRALRLDPIRTGGAVVGVTAFDLTSNRCAIVLKSTAPKRVFAALAPLAHSYQTSFVANATAYPDTNYVNENTTNSSPSLRAIRANHSSYIVAQTTAATPTQCTAIATTLTGT